MWIKYNLPVSELTLRSVRLLLRGVVFTVLGLLTWANRESLGEAPQERLREFTNEQQETRTPGALLREIEDLGKLYSSSEDSLVQEIWILGRYHGQYYWADGPIGQRDDFESRRFRLGGQVKLLSGLTLHGQAVSGRDLTPLYNGFTELWAQWRFLPEISITIGQQKNRFTHDRNVSSRYLNYLERSMLTNLLKLDYTPAITLQGEIGDYSYYTGIFSNATGPNMRKSFTELDSGYSALLAVYHDLGTAFSFDTVTLYGSYLHSEVNKSATNMDRISDGLSGAVIITAGHGSLISEVTAGIDRNQGRIMGLNLQPTYFLDTTTQLVTRYQVAVSSAEQLMDPQVRYEREVGLEAGQLYQALYLGVNFHLAKHRLKLMYGLEYANMSGEDSWTASSMVRFYFGPHSGGAFPMNSVLPHDVD